MAVAGIDIGSQSTKVVILEGDRILAAVTEKRDYDTARVVWRKRRERRAPALQGTSRRLPSSVSSRWKGLGKSLSWSQRSSLKGEDCAVGEKDHRKEEGRKKPAGPTAETERRKT
jgi:hypothetical protein